MKAFIKWVLINSLKGYLAPVGEKVMNMYVDVCRATKFVQRAQKIKRCRRRMQYAAQGVSRNRGNRDDWEKSYVCDRAVEPLMLPSMQLRIVRTATYAIRIFEYRSKVWYIQ